MGFWGKLGKAFSIAGPIAASFIPGGALASTGMKILKGGLTAGGLAAGAGLVGAKVAKDLSTEDENSKLLREQGSKLFGQANPAFGQALDTYGKLASGDKGTLASFTGTGVNELNQAASNQIERAKSTMNRGGAQSKVLAEAPGQLEHAALALRSNARGTALDRLGTLGLSGSQAGNQAIAIGGQLGLQRRGQNIGIAKDIGEGVGTILDKTGVWGKLGKTMGDIFGGNKGGSMPGTDLPEFADTSGPGALNLPEPEFGGLNTSSMTLDALGGNPLDAFGGGQKPLGPLERAYSK